jgi:hypothetical protein
MKTECFVLCDAATDTLGKLNVLGAFDSIQGQQLPVTHAQCAIAARIRVDRSENGEHTVTFKIVDEDGNAVIDPIEGRVRINIPEQRTSQALNMVINLRGLKFEQTGEYSLDLFVDDQPLASAPIHIRQVQPGQGGGGPGFGGPGGPGGPTPPPDYGDKTLV